MKATIRTGARLFKAAMSKIKKTSQKTTTTVKNVCALIKRQARKIRESLLRLFRAFFKRKKKPMAPTLILAYASSEASKQKQAEKPKKAKRKKSRGNHKSKKVSPIKESKPKTRTQIKHQAQEQAITVNEQPMDPKQTIEAFYKEWEAHWGPALTSLDKEYLEQAAFEEARLVMANARLTLKSPYLKAVYNGLNDLIDISDLLEYDAFAKERVKPVLQLYWDQGPEVFTDRLLILHDKGIFPTRSGERKLSLDPRLIPEWLGFV